MLSLLGTLGNLLGGLGEGAQTFGITQGAQKGVEKLKDYLGADQAELTNEGIQKSTINTASMISAEMMGAKAVSNMKFLKDMSDMENSIQGQCGSSMKQVAQSQ